MCIRDSLKDTRAMFDKHMAEDEARDAAKGKKKASKEPSAKEKMKLQKALEKKKKAEKKAKLEAIEKKLRDEAKVAGSARGALEPPGLWLILPAAWSNPRHAMLTRRSRPQWITRTTSRRRRTRRTTQCASDARRRSKSRLGVEIETIPPLTSP